jgi:hypothetical protein
MYHLADEKTPWRTFAFLQVLLVQPPRQLFSAWKEAATKKIPLTQLKNDELYIRKCWSFLSCIFQIMIICIPIVLYCTHCQAATMWWPRPFSWRVKWTRCFPGHWWLHHQGWGGVAWNLRGKQTIWLLRTSLKSPFVGVPDFQSKPHFLKSFNQILFLWPQKVAVASSWSPRISH